MKKLLVAAVALAVFTLNGLDPLLVGLIAFSGGVFASLPGRAKNQRTSFIFITQYLRRPASRLRVAPAQAFRREHWQTRERKPGSARQSGLASHGFQASQTKFDRAARTEVEFRSARPHSSTRAWLRRLLLM
jgi:hypothetical protein